jgi:hypothetical protein
MHWSIGMLITLVLFIALLLTISRTALVPHATNVDERTSLKAPTVVNGRFEASKGGGIAFDWPGVVLEFSVKCGPSVPVEVLVELSMSFSLALDRRIGDDMSIQSAGGGGHRFSVSVDDKPVADFAPSAYPKDRIASYSMSLGGAVDAPNKWYRVRMVKETEAFLGVVRIHDLAIVGDVCEVRRERLARANTRFLFIGDSLSNGYGVKGVGECGELF